MRFVKAVAAGALLALCFPGLALAGSGYESGFGQWDPDNPRAVSGRNEVCKALDEGMENLMRDLRANLGDARTFRKKLVDQAGKIRSLSEIWYHLNCDGDPPIIRRAGL